jgi:hypothetical protein
LTTSTQTHPQRLAEHEARLWKRTFRRIHQEQHPVHQAQTPLHLAAEISVPRCIHDVDLVALVLHRGVFGEDGDSLLALQFVGVHHPLDHHLVAAEHARLPEHVVHQRRLPVVDVGYDRHVANLLSSNHQAGVGPRRSGWALSV